MGTRPAAFGLLRGGRANMNVQIRILAGPLTGEILPISSAKFLIGRDEDCQLRLDSEFVSRHHCALLLDDYTLRIRDLSSKNGTFINGRRIGEGETILLHSDVVAIGDMTFVIEIDQPPGEIAQPLVARPTMEGTAVLEGDTGKVDAQPKRPALSPLENETMTVLWSLGKAATDDVRRAISDPELVFNPRAAGDSRSLAQLSSFSRSRRAPGPRNRGA
jgi:predicted component of type VI protein secretion system